MRNAIRRTECILPVLCQVDQLFCGPKFSAFVHGDAQATLTGGQQTFRNVLGVSIPDKFEFRFAEGPEGG